MRVAPLWIGLAALYKASELACLFPHVKTHLEGTICGSQGGFLPDISSACFDLEAPKLWKKMFYIRVRKYHFIVFCQTSQSILRLYFPKVEWIVTLKTEQQILCQVRWFPILCQKKKKKDNNSVELLSDATRKKKNLLWVSIMWFGAHKLGKVHRLERCYSTKYLPFQCFHLHGNVSPRPHPWGHRARMSSEPCFQVMTGNTPKTWYWCQAPSPAELPSQAKLSFCI